MSTDKTKWVSDLSHSEMGFKVKHMMITTVTGQFAKFEVGAKTIGDDFKNAEVEVNIDVESINTKVNDRDAHLKSDDFFNASDFPYITFKSTGFDGNRLQGLLTIRDITKEVTLDVDFNGIVVDPYGQTKAGFELTGEISRKEFGLKWNAVTEAGSIVVSDAVKLSISVQLVKQA